MLDWQQATRSSSQRLYYPLQDVLQMRGGWCTSLHMALVPPAWPKPCRMGHFFPGPPGGIAQLPKWPSAQPEMGQQLHRAGVFPLLEISKHRQCHWNAAKQWSGWGRWIQQKSLPSQGNLLLLIRHYPFPPPLIQKGRFSKELSDSRNRSCNKNGEVGSSTSRAGCSVTIADRQNVHTLWARMDSTGCRQPQARRAESCSSFPLEAGTLLSFSYLFQFG